jgi:hypothetical protein
MPGRIAPTGYARGPTGMSGHGIVALTTSES